MFILWHRLCVTENKGVGMFGLKVREWFNGEHDSVEKLTKPRPKKRLKVKSMLKQEDENNGKWFYPIKMSDMVGIKIPLYKTATKKPT
jgi:hypothetical protein